jgi:3-oxoacyl-[acyl-carrier protein] reductase
MEKLLEGKSCIVTGGSRGIGRAIVLELAKAGANVVFSYHSSEAKALELVSEIETYGVKALAVKSDAASFDDAKSLCDATLAAFGSIDAIVNNAGITRDTLLMRMSEQQWDEVIDNNLKSAFNLTKHASTIMLKQRKGSIVNITSIVGIKGQAGQVNYSASKAGMIGLTKAVADELGSRNIRCNAIAPGFIQTEMTDELPEDLKKRYLDQIPMKRFATADEVAKVVVFLASDMSSYVTGQVIGVCGGLAR